MKRVFLSLLVVLVLTFSFLAFNTQSLLASDEEDLVSKVLSEINLTKENLKYSDSAINRLPRDPFRLPFFDDKLKDPINTPTFLKSNASYLLSNANSLRNLIYYSSLRLGYSNSSFPDYDIDYSFKIVENNPLLYAVSEIHTFSGKPLSSWSFEYLKKEVEKIPIELQKEIAKILYASIDFKIFRDAAFNDIDKLELVKAFNNPAALFTDDSFDLLTYNIALKCDYSLLFYGGVQLTNTIDKSLAEIKKLSLPKNLDFNWTTPLGRIILKGKDNDEYHFNDVLFLLDAGGNDTYFNGAGVNSSFFNPVSICIDLAGNDIYETKTDITYSQGAGVFGAGILLDLDGDDNYNSSDYSQGFGCFGIGILKDFSGNDTYNSNVLSQGAALYGIGLLIDTDGNDSFNAYLASQGFGFSKGFGALIDTKGNDSYVANDENIIYPSAQTTEHNTSLCQGFGFGRRADLSDGKNMSGGFGLLIDASGDDTYSCGVFGQGSAYWAGTGVLYDGDGDDSYKGIWYVQGGVAHFGIGLLLDEKGNDSYDALINMAQGAGHDFSLGYLIDKEGDDIYTAPNLALGGGNSNGMGFFADCGGNDTYKIRENAQIVLGKAALESQLKGTWREAEFTFGLFIDRGGNDNYNVDFAKDNTIWTYKTDIETVLGGGIDSETGSLTGFVP